MNIKLPNMKNPNAVSLGSLGGRAKSEKKTEASRTNGKKGGRPTFVDLIEKEIEKCYDEEGNPSDDQEALTFQDGLYRALAILKNPA